MSHWIYKNIPIDELPNDVFGFVYKITNIINGKKYIGRKNANKTRSKPLKKLDGTISKKRQKVTTSSGWERYTGSSKILNEDIKIYGKHNFIFEILGFAFTKGQLSYLEENIQHRLGVLYNNDEYYNDSIGSRNHIGTKFDERFLEEIKNIKL